MNIKEQKATIDRLLNFVGINPYNALELLNTELARQWSEGSGMIPVLAHCVQVLSEHPVGFAGPLNQQIADAGAKLLELHFLIDQIREAMLNSTSERSEQ